ncbi:MAG TPA: GGDEF domain-containing protein [Anaerolineales bacterium]|nr:GGDEF domain-containing protein [Anaerolineales bacterium]
MDRAGQVVHRLRSSFFPRIQPDLRASRTRLAQAVSYTHLGLVGLWLAGLLGLSLLRGRPVQGMAVQLGAIAVLALAWWAAHGLLRQGRLLPAGYLLSTALLLYVAAGTLLLPQYALHLGMAYLLSVLAAAAIVGRTASFLFAALSVLLQVLILQFAPALGPATAALRQEGTLLLYFLIHAGVVGAVAGVSNALAVQIEQTIGGLHRQAEQMARLAHTDPLTGLANRRHLFERLESEFARAQRYRRPFTLLYIDLDGFKSINDRFGHLFGDEILRGSALSMQAVLRSTDLLARIGGDEFAVLMPETSLGGADYVVGKLRKALAAYSRQLSPALPPLTLSVGIGEIGEEDEAIEDILARADKAQYLAKASGKDTTRTQEDLKPQGMPG